MMASHLGEPQVACEPGENGDKTMNKRGMMFCPSMPIQYNYSCYWSHYGMMIYGVGGLRLSDNIKAITKFSRMRYPSQAFLIADSSAGWMTKDNGYYSIDATTSSLPDLVGSKWGLRHKNSCNVVYAGGNVGNVTYNRIINLLQTGPGGGTWGWQTNREFGYNN